MSKAERVLALLLVTLVVAVGVFFVTPAGVALRNGYNFAVQKMMLPAMKPGKRWRTPAGP